MKGLNMFKYSINLEWSVEDESYIATIQEFPGLSAFGEDPEEAVKEAITAAKGFLNIIKEDGDEIPEPIVKKKFSGQTRLRLPKSLHQKLAFEANKEGVSFNTHVVTLLSEGNNSKKIERKIDKLRILINEHKIIETQTEPKSAAFVQQVEWDNLNSTMAIN